MSVFISNTTLKNPYPGIRSFETQESDLFFGREKQIGELLQIIKSKRFVAITGSSGSGKSSLVKAGLIPELLKESTQWNYIIVRPGNDPIANLAISVTNFLNSSDTNIINEEIYQKNEEFLRKNTLVELLKKNNFNKKLLIYVDQFEEIFRYSTNQLELATEKYAKQFVDIIISSALQNEIPIYSIISLRSDFLSECTEYDGLANLINTGHYLIPQMTIEEKEHAIVGPAKYFGSEISQDLMLQIKTYIKRNQVSLPVLQHTLMRTWEYYLKHQNDSNRLELIHYNAIGTLSDALSIHVEQIYANIYSDKYKKIAERIFKSLTYIDKENIGTRRPTTLEEICNISGAGEQDVINVIDEFRSASCSFLLPPPNVKLNIESIIDISHESIMFLWKRLVIWVDEETKSAQMYMRLSKSSELYHEGKTGLLVSPDLQIAMKWQTDNHPNASWAERYDPAFERAITYLEYSKKEYDREVTAKEQKQKRNLKRANAVAFLLGTAALISILFLVIALNLKFKAEGSEKIAKDKERIAVTETKIAEEKKKEAFSHKRIAEQQQQIAEQQKLIADEQRKFAIVQQNEAILQKHKAQIAEKDAVSARDIARKLQKDAEKLRDEAFEQKKLAEQQKSRAEKSEAKTDTLRRLAIAKSLAIQAVKIYNENKNVPYLPESRKRLPIIMALQAYNFNKNSGGNTSNSDIFTALSTIAELNTLIRGNDSHTAAVRGVVVSNDGKTFVSCSDDGTIKVHYSNNEKATFLLKTSADAKKGIRCLAYSNDNKYLAAGCVSGKIYLWKTSDFNLKPVILSGHTDIVNQVVFSENSQTIYSVSNDGNVRDWKIGDLQQTKILLGFNEKVTSISMSPDYSMFVIGTEKGTISIYSIENKSKKSEINLNNIAITSILWTENNDIIAALVSGKISIYKSKDLKNSKRDFFCHNSGINSMIYTKNNSLITCSYDGTVKMWNYNNLEYEPILLSKHDSWVYTIAMSYDKTKLLSGSADKNIKITTIDQNLLKTHLRSKVNENMSEKDWILYVGEGIDYKKELPE